MYFGNKSMNVFLDDFNIKLDLLKNKKIYDFLSLEI